MHNSIPRGVVWPQACADAADFTSFTALLRSMTPNAIDQELRSMQACLLAPLHVRMLQWDAQ